MAEIPVYRFDSLESTQAKAFELLESEGPLWVVAEEQTKGRGRYTRAWASERGKSFIASYAFRSDVSSLEGLSLVVGLGALRGLDSSELLLKWPNDLMLKDSKVGGILIESRSQGREAAVVVGVGINWFEVESKEGIRYAGLGRRADEIRLRSPIEEIVSDFLLKRSGFRSFQAEYLEKIWGLHREVEMEVNAQKLRVQILGVNADGHLLTRTQGELRLMDSGEIVQVR